MSKRALVWGAGGFGQNVAELLRTLGYTVEGFIDYDPDKLDTIAEPGGARVVFSQEEALRRLDAGEGLGVDGVALAIGNDAIRLRFARILEEQGLLFPALIHPSVFLSPSAEIGAGSIVLAGAFVEASVRIGMAAILNLGCVVGHDTHVGAGVHISPNTVLCGYVRIGDEVLVGAGSVVIASRKVGEGATVGAGAVVIRDVEPGQVVVGNPARVIGGA